ncbi:farnesol dehydrogenase-like isoform X2 [Pseudomyrmex gracilis]|nr:farnesol dehydrogenase-like isoform X2 [Pseudomyrmex gracilis]
MKVIAVARRVDKLQELAADVQRKFNAKLHFVKCDVEKEEEILEVFKWAEKHLGGVDVLINNAGIISWASLSEDTTENFHRMMNVNAIAPAICSREFIQSVKKRKASGHIINVSSIAGHIAEMMDLSMSIYPASKYAVRGMAATLRGDLAKEKSDVKVTNISPGPVKTDFLAKYASAANPTLEDKDIADTVIYILSMPPHVQ